MDSTVRARYDWDFDIRTCVAEIPEANSCKFLVSQKRFMPRVNISRNRVFQTILEKTYEYRLRDKISRSFAQSRERGGPDATVRVWTLYA